MKITAFMLLQMHTKLPSSWAKTSKTGIYQDLIVNLYFL